MKRYELKDKERQAAFEKVFPGFGRLLNEACAVCPADTVVHISSHGVAGQDFPHFYELSFPRSIIEEVVAYGPKGWNKYPEVTPPEDIPLRCEGHDSDTGRPFRAILRYLDGGFCFDSVAHHYRSIFPDMVIDRFRPWDEEEKNE